MIQTAFNAIQQIIPLPLLGMAAALGLSLVLAMRARQIVRPRMGSVTPDAYTAQARMRVFSQIFLLGAIVLGFFIVRGDFSDNDPQPTPYPEGYVGEIDPLANLTLTIPALGLKTTIIEAPVVANQWDISRLTTEVAHLAGTAYPGGTGNAVLAGHVTIPNAGWGPFQELESIPIGEHIFIEYGSQTLMTYEVTEIFTVGPSEVSVVFPQGDDRLTLITCAGWSEITESYALRVIVVAYPVNPTEQPG